MRLTEEHTAHIADQKDRQMKQKPITNKNLNGLRNDPALFLAFLLKKTQVVVHHVDSLFSVYFTHRFHFTR